MTKTFDPSLTEDKDRVRFEIGDVDEGAMFLDDETIEAILASFSDDIGLTVVSCARSIANQLRRPDCRVDWMSESQMVAAAESFDRMAEAKAAEWGVGGSTSTNVFIERRDAYWDKDDTD